MIGRRVYNTKNIYSSSIYKYSTFCSYRFGSTNSFSVFNVKMLERFYCTFPIYASRLNELTWDHYIELFRISDFSRRYFYFEVALFCRSSVLDLRTIIDNDVYSFMKSKKVLN